MNILIFQKSTEIVLKTLNVEKIFLKNLQI